jgi:hypothetical protein
LFGKGHSPLPNCVCGTSQGCEYRELNPTQNKQDSRDVENALRLLIKQKEKLYPEVRFRIIDAYIKEVNGKKSRDPNVWFRNVDVAASRRIGRETVQYVSNIYAYYSAYRLLADKSSEKKETKRKLL